MSLDPDAQLVIDMIQASGRPRMETVPPHELREVYRGASKVLSPDPPEVDDVRDLSAPGPAGAIPLRLYRAGKGRLPALVFFHGGGFCIGDLDSYDYMCRRLAIGAGCAVVSVDYRLAPEHKFPAGVEDCAAAVRWTAENEATLAIDRARLAVGGDSSGGNLSAVMAHLARDGDLPPLRYQLLLYPTVDMGMRHSSYQLDLSRFPIAPDTVRYFHEHYLRDERDRADWRASPLLAPKFTGLAPTFILTAGYDPLRDEGAEYARVLEANGVAVTFVHMSDQMHGFLSMGRVIRAAETALELASASLRRALQRS